MEVYADIVLNHRMGADEMETVTVHQVNEENRNEVIREAFQVDAMTKFTFPGEMENILISFGIISVLAVLIKLKQEMKNRMGFSKSITNMELCGTST
jgi:hypothetical protein